MPGTATTTTTTTTGITATDTSRQPTINQWGHPTDPALPSKASPRGQSLPQRTAVGHGPSLKHSNSAPQSRTVAPAVGPLTAAAGARVGLGRLGTAGVDRQHHNSNYSSSSTAAGGHGARPLPAAASAAGGAGVGPVAARGAAFESSQRGGEQSSTAVSSSTGPRQGMQMPSRGLAGNKLAAPGAATAALGHAPYASPPAAAVIGGQQPPTPGYTKALLHTPSRILSKQQHHQQQQHNAARSPRGKVPHLGQAPQFNSSAADTAQAHAAQGMTARTGRLSNAGFATPPRWRPSNADAAAATPPQCRGGRTPTDVLLSPRLAVIGSARRVDALGRLAGVSNKQPGKGPLGRAYGIQQEGHFVVSMPVQKTH